MVAYSEPGDGVRLAVSMTGAGWMGRAGSGVGLGLVEGVWLGFHIALKVFPFLSWLDGGFQGRAICHEP